MKRHEEVRALLQEYVTGFARATSGGVGTLFLRFQDEANGHVIPKKTWIYLNMSAVASPEDLSRLRAFVEIVSQLSQSADFQWRECYHSFWKETLMDPLSFNVLSKSEARNPDPTEFDSVDQLTKCTIGPRFAMDFSRGREGCDRGKLDSLRAFLFMDPTQALGEKHSRILSRLTTARDRSRDEGDSRATVSTALADAKSPLPRIELGLAVSWIGTVTALFREQFEILQEFAEHEQHKKHHDRRNATAQFELSSLWIAAGGAILEPIDIAIVVDAIGSATSTIRHLSIKDAYNLLLMADRLSAFGHLLRTTVCRLGDNEPTLQTLQLHNVPSTFQSLASIFSALRHANSLTDLDIKCSVSTAAHNRHPESSKLIWAWIAFGIFHPDSEARLDRLSLSGPPLTPDDVATFESVIRSTHPARELWILKHGDLPQGKGLEEIPMPEGQRVLVQLKPKTKFKAFPKVRSQALEAVAVESEEFEVALQLETWICVVVPGCGLG